MASRVAVGLLTWASAQSPSELVARGGVAFEAAGDCSGNCSLSYVRKSLKLFDAAEAAGFPQAELWQRGISLYYAERFQEAAGQFREDASVNPNDTEEAVWAFGSEARTLGFEAARERLVVVERETRPYMAAIYSLFQGRTTATELAARARDPETQAVDAAYYRFYLGFFHEAKGQAEEAQSWISALAASDYAKASRCTVEDYVDCVGIFALVHARVRNWLPVTAEDLVSQGEQAFAAVKLPRSLQLFDQAVVSGYDGAILWQQGLTQYYLGLFADGSKLFHENYEALGKHHDAEESVWAFICEAQINGFEKARQEMLVITNETRPYMRNVYDLFRGNMQIDAIEQLAIESSSQEDAFYYALYAGLFEESAGNAIDAKAWVLRAARSGYFERTDDLMGAVAIVHAQVRGWSGLPESMNAAAQLKAPKGGQISVEDFAELNISRPTPGIGEVLVRIEGASLNPFEVREAEGLEGDFEYPHVNGNDFAGTVAAVGPGVTRLQAGDRVWGLSWFEGAHAQFLTVSEAGVWGVCDDGKLCDLVGLAPSSLPLADSAVMPIVAMTNLFGFRTAQGPWTENHTVVILGGSGGIGHLAIQLAKAWGATTVITTCGTDHLEFCRRMGADRVIDYHKEDWHDALEPRSVDFVYDAATQNGTGNKAYDVLRDGGHFVTLQPWPLANETVAKSRPAVTQNFIAMPDAHFTYKDLDEMRWLVDSGRVVPHVEKNFSLAELGEAFLEQKAGHTVGKLSIRAGGRSEAAIIFV